MRIENLLEQIEMMRLLDGLDRDMNYGQLPEYLLEDRTPERGVQSRDSMFNNQGVTMSIGHGGGPSAEQIDLPYADKPVQEEIPVSFSDFFNGNPMYEYQPSLMLPKRDEIDG